MDRIDAHLFLDMVRGGAARLGTGRKAVNDLNVFPIPDGDTGDNMYMTIFSGCKAAGNSLGEAARNVSDAMLMGARGNSGVILSRIFAGFAKGVEGVSEAGLEEFSKAMQSGVRESYLAVSEPVEGTILTVFREGVDAASGSNTLGEYLDRLVTAMEQSLEHTPELLDVLKKAGVVDSGGAGLLYIIEGMRAVFNGEAVQLIEESLPNAPQAVDISAFTEDSVLEFGYCTEFLLRLQRSKVDLDSFDETVMSEWLASHGESLVFFRDGSIIKVHVHTHTPGDILNHCQQYGEYLTVKIENMTLEHHENHMDERFRKSRKAYGVVAVASGEGLVETFKELGADQVIEGGQTMNPPVQSFLDAFDRVNADTVFVLPDNSNILLTARQAAGMYKGSDIRVIPCKTLGEGYYALANLDTESGNPDEIEAVMTKAAGEVVTGLVSRAIRDSEDVREGEFVGISGKEIVSSGESPENALVSLAGALDAGSHDVILVFLGSGAAEPGQAVEALARQYPRSEVILKPGGQPVYEYIIVLF
ncbi:MAG: DAK2 domain-containing protein [Bacteroidales bacterium]|nr:DAK2 domain-containing protein [Bacteroidales bacterium]